VNIIVLHKTNSNK